MIRLHVTAEGQTEKAWVDKMLTPHLAKFGVYADARCVLTSKDKRAAKVYRGGLLSYEKAKRDIIHTSRQAGVGKRAGGGRKNLFVLQFPHESGGQGVPNPLRGLGGGATQLLSHHAHALESLGFFVFSSRKRPLHRERRLCDPRLHHRLLSSFMQGKKMPLLPPPTDAAASLYFLGPKSEQRKFLEESLGLVLQDYIFWRRNYYPKDPPAISYHHLHSPEALHLKETFIQELFSFIADLKLDVPVFSPRYMAHMVSETTLPSLVAYIATLLYNPNNVSTEASPVPWGSFAPQTPCQGV